ncbi:MAG: HipA domain-containing protein [Sandaracinaceae bacterium]|nr:HipA domain-containing protein [Sandaracinaceae bacterium]
MALASEVLTQRDGLSASFGGETEREDALRDILRVGTSAGGARAKAVIAWNPEMNGGALGAGAGRSGLRALALEVRRSRRQSRQGARGSQGLLRDQYAYSRMARAAGITMSECRLLEENGRRHFMTKRFDRLEEALSSTCSRSRRSRTSTSTRRGLLLRAGRCS